MPKHKLTLLDGEEHETYGAVDSAVGPVNISKTVRRLIDMLAKLNITTKNLADHGIKIDELAAILALPWYARVQRWLVYDETIRKILLWSLLRNKNISVLTSEVAAELENPSLLNEIEQSPATALVVNECTIQRDIIKGTCNKLNDKLLLYFTNGEEYHESALPSVTL